jgi:hypothetical protein
MRQNRGIPCRNGPRRWIRLSELPTTPFAAAYRLDFELETSRQFRAMNVTNCSSMGGGFPEVKCRGIAFNSAARKTTRCV